MAALLVVFALTTSGLLISFNNRLDRQLEQQNELQSIIDEQDVNIQSLQDTLTQSILDSENTAQIEGLIARIESQQIVLDNQEEVLKELRGLLSSTDDDGTIVVFTPYTVQKGDHLADICSDFGLDYQANIRIIKAINGIADVNMIYVGQTIILPIPQSR